MIDQKSAASALCWATAAIIWILSLAWLVRNPAFRDAESTVGYSGLYVLGFFVYMFAGVLIAGLGLLLKPAGERVTHVYRTVFAVSGVLALGGLLQTC